MQFEGNDMDKKLREAADNHYPSYDDGAWKKMELLLDKHLPQRKEKRRILLFLLLFLLLGGGSIYFLVSKPWQPAKSQDITLQNDQPQTTDPLKALSREAEKVSENLSTRLENNEVTGNTIHVISADKKSTIQLRHQQYVDAAREIIKSRVKEIVVPTDMPAIKSGVTDEIKTEESKPITEVNTETQKTDLSKEEKTTEKKSIDTEQKEAEKSVTFLKDDKQSKNNSFFISLSGGPDISSVSNEFGKTKFLGGIGIGYTFNDRFTLRTGLYTARKIYTAGKEDYKPAVTPPNYMYLENISADCKVYEVPLSLTYHFGRSAKQNFFASAGLSSYFMKKEVYDYNYKYPGNVFYTHRYTYNNKNNHYFSVAGLSVGYQRNINKTFSISAEPYIRLPLSGVGNGNVRLHSSGILISASVKPFQNSEKKKALPVNGKNQ